MQMLIVRMLVIAAAMLCAACSTSRSFAPRESRNGTGPTGMPAAVYAMPSAMQGDVRLWSDGARRSSPEGMEERTELLLGIEIENSGDAPIRVAPEDVVVRAVVGEKGTFEARAAEAVAVEGAPPLSAVEAAPRTTARVGFLFVVDGAMPRDIESFEAHWRARGAGDASYAQVTPFVAYVPEPNRYAWRDPWPYWGMGFGYWGYGYPCRYPYPYRWR